MQTCSKDQSINNLFWTFLTHLKETFPNQLRGRKRLEKQHSVGIPKYFIWCIVYIKKIAEGEKRLWLFLWLSSPYLPRDNPLKCCCPLNLKARSSVFLLCHVEPDWPLRPQFTPQKALQLLIAMRNYTLRATLRVRITTSRQQERGRRHRRVNVFISFFKWMLRTCLNHAWDAAGVEQHFKKGAVETVTFRSRREGN